MSLSKEIQDFVANYDAAEKNAITKEHNAAISEYYKKKNEITEALGNAKNQNDPKTLVNNAQKNAHDNAKFAIPEINTSANDIPTSDERDLKIRTVYGEGADQGGTGQAAIAHVINNRVKSGQFGNNATEVITAPEQFSLWNKGDPAGEKARKLDPNSKEYQRIGAIVDAIDAGQLNDPTNGATHYYAHDIVNPDWAPGLAKQNRVVIGGHTFVGKLPTKVAAPTPAPTVGALPVAPSNEYASNDDLDDPDSPVQTYLGGGTVRPTAGPSRPDRIADAQPGVAIPEASHGTMPGGSTTASIASSPGYEGGGPTDNAPQDTQQDQPNLLDGLGDAINDGVKYIHDKFNLGATNNQAVPTSDHAANLNRFHTGEGAATPAALKAVTDTIDPKNQFTEELRNAAGLNAVYQFHKNRGDYDKASKAAGELLLHMRGVTAQYGDKAYEYLKNGNIEKGAEQVVDGYNKGMPNGMSVSAKVNPDKTVTMTETNPKGEAVTNVVLNEKQLLGAALGMKDGTAYWNVMRQAAGKHDPDYVPQRAINPASVRSPEQTAAFQTAMQPQGSPQTGGSQVGGSSIGGNAQTAIPAMPQLPDLSQIHPQDRSAVIAKYNAEMNQYKYLNPQSKAGANKLPDASKRNETLSLIQGSLDDFEKGLPNGQKLAEIDRKHIGNATYHILRNNDFHPDEARDAVLELSNPKSKAFDAAKPGEPIDLPDGTQVTLDKQSYGAIKALRQKKLNDLSASQAETKATNEKMTKLKNNADDATMYSPIRNAPVAISFAKRMLDNYLAEKNNQAAAQ